MKQWIKKIKYGLYNLWIWRKVIWRDRNFDYAYLYDIMEFKLDLLYKGLISYNNTSHDDYRYILIAKDLIRKIRDEEYLFIDEPHSKSKIQNNIAKHNKAKKLLSKILEEKLERWWD